MRLLIILILLVGSLASAGTLERIAERHVMVNAVDPSYPPFSFLNERNEMDGFDIDVARAVAERLGAKLKVETPSWALITSGRWRGRWDVCICSLTPDRQKAQVLDFVVPYYQSPAVLVTTAQNAALQSARDITARRIGVEQGSSYERYLLKQLEILAPGAPKIDYPFERVDIAVYANEDLAYQDLALGAGRRVDAIVANQVSAEARIAKMPGRFRIVGGPLYAEPNWVATDKGDVAFQRRLQEVFTALKKDGTLARISRKWLGRDATE